MKAAKGQGEDSSSDENTSNEADADDIKVITLNGHSITATLEKIKCRFGPDE